MRAAPLIALLAGCTTLGPMPTSTGISALPTGRPGGEISASIAPIFRLSDSASGNDPDGNANPQLGALFDPDRLLGIPGLFVAARLWGEHGDNGLDLGRRAKGGFHVARLAGMFSVGWMPRIVNGMEDSGQTYITGGVSLTIGFGAAE